MHQHIQIARLVSRSRCHGQQHVPAAQEPGAVCGVQPFEHRGDHEHEWTGESHRDCRVKGLTPGLK